MPIKTAFLNSNGPNEGVGTPAAKPTDRYRPSHANERSAGSVYVPPTAS
jgi:hypothetical protein